jgi:hypothetical protein
MNPFYQLFYCEYPIKHNLNAAKEIIKILIDNYDNYYDLITNLEEPKTEDEYILDLLYSFLPNDENNLCQICLQTEPKKSLINCCRCTTGTHVECLLKLNTFKTLNKCSICLGKYKINEPFYLMKDTKDIGVFGNEQVFVKERIFFPYNDFYYRPNISNSSLMKYENIARLTMAILYLQVKRVKQLLSEKVILDELPTYYFGYIGYKQTPLHALCTGNTGNMCTYSPYYIRTNARKYEKILSMLIKTKKINIHQKDTFNKTAKEYAQEHNLIQLEQILSQY